MNKTYPYLIENLEEWPINKLHKNRKEFVSEIDELVLERLMEKPTKELSQIIATTIYRERIRIKEEPWKVDPPNESQFWKRIRKKLVKHSLDHSEEKARAANKEILSKIIHRYSEEIVATFRIPTFKFARSFTAALFNRLLNTFAGRNWHRIYGSKHRLEERLKMTGEIEKLRSLMTKGSVVIVPTHHSNLDSLLIGFTLDLVAGLPFPSFGAGLNLYNTGYTAYFMNRMGAYRLDRRKKNPIYLETLKGMSNLAIQKGTNTLFFPGGTRSRSGKLETKDNLKLGMVGTAVEAQRILFQKEDNKKVFIVPLVLSYHFVLEAKSLIEQYLKMTGKEQYIKTKDESSSFRQNVRFVWSLFSEANEIIMSVGKPMDVLGNFVDMEGRSFDRHGREVDVKEYFMSDRQVTADLQREREYTRLLGNRIAERFHKDNIVLSSHLVAFATFNILKHENPQLDLYGILRLPEEDYFFPEELLHYVVRDLQHALIKKEANGQIKLSDLVKGDITTLIKDGLKRLGTYHGEKPLIINKKKQIVSESFKVLYFYHNRLENYNLDQEIKWPKHYEIEVEEG